MAEGFAGRQAVIPTWYVLTIQALSLQWTKCDRVFCLLFCSYLLILLVRTQDLFDAK